MRIISDWKDYYDCLQRFDEDRQTLYIRDQRRVEIRSKWPFPMRGTGYERRLDRSGFSTIEHIIGFCGKIYPLLELSCWSAGSSLCRTMAEVDSYAEAHMKPIEFEQFNSNSYKGLYKTSFLDKTQRRPAFAEFFAACHQRQDDYRTMFEKERCPIFVASRAHKEYRGDVEGEIVYNAALKEYEFFRVFDPPRAYQEIVCFMNNLAVPFKPIPVLDDETMAQVHGFDRFSFRQDPIKRKKGKKG
jgi:hypothetical protein